MKTTKITPTEITDGMLSIQLSNAINKNVNKNLDEPAQMTPALD